jgi:hypothetical protein
VPEVGARLKMEAPVVREGVVAVGVFGVGDGGDLGDVEGAGCVPSPWWNVDYGLERHLGK